MIRNADTAFQLILLAATFSVVLLAPTKCRLRLSSRSATLNKNGNLTVLCDASCFGVNLNGMFGWFDKTNQKIPNSGRIFSMTYNRGRYARLFIRNFTEDDAGVFVCSKMDGNDRIDIPFHLNGGMVHGLELDSGPERGDIHSNEFEIPDIRSVRSVRSRLRREADDSSLTSDSPDETTSETHSGDTTVSQSMDETSSSKMSEMTNAELTSENPPTELSTEIKPESEPSPESKTKPESKPEPESNSEPDTETEPVPETEPELLPNQDPSEKSIQTTTDNMPTPNSSPNTEFGRRGLIAFVLTLAVAILLFYALMLTICIPRCLARRKAMDLEKSRKVDKDNKDEKNAPEAIKLSKIEDNGLPSPGPSDSGFTTIDLDEQTDKKDEQTDKKEETVVVGTEVKASDAGVATEGTGQNSKEPPTEELKEDPAKSTEDSLLNSILQVSGEKQDTKPVDGDIAFIDQAPSSSSTNTTPTVVDEPHDTTKTTEVRLDIVESDDGHKQIKLSTSMPPPPEELLVPESPASDGDAFQSSDVNV